MDDDKKDDKKVILFPVPDGYEVAEMDKIVYCKGAGKQSHVYIEGKETHITVCYGLKKLGEKLPGKTYLRIHNSFIINFNKMKKYFRLKESRSADEQR